MSIASPGRLAKASGDVRVHEHLMSVAFTHLDEDAGVLQPGRQPPLMWEITLPELLELASQSTDYTAVVNAWRAGEKVGQITFTYTSNFDSFTMTFVAGGGFTSLHVLSLSAPTWAVVIRSADETRVLLLNSQTHEVLGGDAGIDDLDVLIFPAQQVQLGLQDIRTGVDAVADGPKVAYSGAATDKSRCKNNRKGGWVVSIAVAVGAALAVPTGGSSVVAVVGFLAAGAAGGAGAAMTENAYGTCVDEAEEKERQEKAAQEAAQDQDEEGGE